MLQSWETCWKLHPVCFMISSDALIWYRFSGYTKPYSITSSLVLTISLLLPELTTTATRPVSRLSKTCANECNIITQLPLMLQLCVCVIVWSHQQLCKNWECINNLILVRQRFYISLNLRQSVCPRRYYVMYVCHDGLLLFMSACGGYLGVPTTTTPLVRC